MQKQGKRDQTRLTRTYGMRLSNDSKKEITKCLLGL